MPRRSQVREINEFSADSTLSEPLTVCLIWMKARSSNRSGRIGIYEGMGSLQTDWAHGWLSPTNNHFKDILPVNKFEAVVRKMQLRLLLLLMRRWLPLLLMLLLLLLCCCCCCCCCCFFFDTRFPLRLPLCFPPLQRILKSSSFESCHPLIEHDSLRARLQLHCMIASSSVRPAKPACLTVA